MFLPRRQALYLVQLVSSDDIISHRILLIPILYGQTRFVQSILTEDTDKRSSEGRGNGFGKAMITKLIQRGTFGAHGRGLDWTGPFLAKRDSQAASSRAVMSVDPSKSGLVEFLMLATFDIHY